MQVDTVIVGAGPGGLAAARAAKRVGKRVLVIDDNWGPGGQIWRGRAGLIVEGVEFQFGRQLASLDVDYGQLILACGARELFLPFPGWTLPHVLGAGGLQALVKTGLHIQGKRVVVAGSGPLLLAVAANLNTAGATVVLVAEQASWGSLMRFGLGLWRWPTKIVQANELASWNYRAELWPVEASAGAVKMSDGRTWECDYVACGFGLVPNVELVHQPRPERFEIGCAFKVIGVVPAHFKNAELITFPPDGKFQVPAANVYTLGHIGGSKCFACIKIMFDFIEHPR